MWKNEPLSVHFLSDCPHCSDSANIHACMWHGRGASGRCWCLGEQLQADCGTDLISTGLVTLRAFQELFRRQQGFQEGRWEILVWEFLKVLNETQ